MHSATIPLLALALLTPLQAGDSPVEVKDLGFRFSLEELQMPAQDERMGLAGILGYRQLSPRFSVGAGFFGAVRGVRGGRVTFGFETAFRQPLFKGVALDAGLFLGGGGGGQPYALYGGGLMLRPRLGLSWQTGREQLGIGLSHIRFPSGLIRSTQVAVTWEHRLQVLGLNRDPGSLTEKLGNLLPEALDFHMERGFVELTHQHYTHSGGLYHKGTNMQDLPAPSILGASLGFGPDASRFFLVEAAAAYRGQSDGYMEVLLGVGGRVFLDSGKRFALRGSLSAGTGGGGLLGVGGGLLVKGSAGAQFRFDSGVYVGLEAGRFSAPSTPLRANTCTLRVGYDFGFAVPGRARREGNTHPEVRAVGWRFRPTLSRYQRSQRKVIGDRSQPVDMIGVAVDDMLNDSVYLTGQAAFGITGNAGGWATGMAGVGLQTPGFLGGSNRLVAEFLVGAGGGQLSTSGGGIAQVKAGWAYQADQNWGLQFMVGRTKAFKGSLDTPMLELGLVFRGVSLLGK